MRAHSCLARLMIKPLDGRRTTSTSGVCSKATGISPICTCWKAHEAFGHVASSITYVGVLRVCFPPETHRGQSTLLRARALATGHQTWRALSLFQTLLPLSFSLAFFLHLPPFHFPLSTFHTTSTSPPLFSFVRSPVSCAMENRASPAGTKPLIQRCRR